MRLKAPPCPAGGQEKKPVAPFLPITHESRLNISVGLMVYRGGYNDGKEIPYVKRAPSFFYAAETELH